MNVFDFIDKNDIDIDIMLISKFMLSHNIDYLYVANGYLKQQTSDKNSFVKWFPNFRCSTNIFYRGWKDQSISHTIFSSDRKPYNFYNVDNPLSRARKAMSAEPKMIIKIKIDGSKVYVKYKAYSNLDHTNRVIETHDVDTLDGINLFNSYLCGYYPMNTDDITSLMNNMIKIYNKHNLLS